MGRQKPLQQGRLFQCHRLATGGRCRAAATIPRRIGPILKKANTMNRMTAKDFDPGLLELYDFYADGRITKRTVARSVKA